MALTDLKPTEAAEWWRREPTMWPGREQRAEAAVENTRGWTVSPAAGGICFWSFSGTVWENVPCLPRDENGTGWKYTISWCDGTGRIGERVGKSVGKKSREFGREIGRECGREYGQGYMIGTWVRDRVGKTIGNNIAENSILEIGGRRNREWWEYDRERELCVGSVYPVEGNAIQLVLLPKYWYNSAYGMYHVTHQVSQGRTKIVYVEKAAVVFFEAQTRGVYYNQLMKNVEEQFFLDLCAKKAF